MEVQFRDFNNADILFETSMLVDWKEIEQVLNNMPLHLKESDQAGKQGNPIFDTVGTNSYIKYALFERGWVSAVPIPDEYKFLGTDIDFFKSGIIIEVQFSNYPFLYNNLIRSELFYQSKTPFLSYQPTVLIIITKGHMFPASNSTLYYEQAIKQINALTNNNVFHIPIRVVGLFSPIDVDLKVLWTTYKNPRSREVISRVERMCVISARKGRFDILLT